MESSRWELHAACLGLTSYTSSNLCVFIFRNRSGRHRGEKCLSEGVSHLVAIVLKVKGNRGVFIIIRIMESALLTLVFHYLVGMSIAVCTVIRNVVPFPGCRRELLFFR